MGVEDDKTALQHSNVSITAVCDLYKGRIKVAKKIWGANLFATNHYKELLKRSDVDAVIVAPPRPLAYAYNGKRLAVLQACVCKNTYGAFGR